ncbi:MAG: TonB-dependent receptor, partial [Thiovulaceae bacterium]|nr:TonB-dependent receptor [Sulfurimonadaceae bacterium]
MKALLSILLLSSLGFAEDNTTKAQHFDTLSVTATKTATRTRDISQSIAVVDRAKLDQLPMTNINDALQEIPGVLAVSKNGGYDSRLYIRGAGIKANYGIREIMILRDGFPMTDPDSFSRMDFINMEDVKQIEVTKGPGSIYASGSAGGTINIIPFSVFDNTDDRIKIGYGSFNSRKAHFKVSAKVSDKDFVSLTASHQYNEATWRNHNKFENYQTSLKYGHIFDDSSTVETELSYTKSDLELPTKLTQAEFDLYKTTGTVESTSDLFQHSARNSEVLFFSTKYEKDFDGFTFAPKIFYNGWSHFHPVTGFINDSTGNHVFGTDLQINADHTLFSKEAKLVTGLSIRNDMSIGEEKYTYL